MTFVDASALVSILTGEPSRSTLIARLESASLLLTSGFAVFETVLAVARKKALSVAEAQAEVEEFIELAGMQVIAIAARETALALTAHARFGKGRHPARLNLGDCFAYACAKAHGARLLFVGDDFPQTDIAPAP